MAIVVTDPDTGQSYAIYVDPATGESASVPITAAQAAAATSSSNVDEYGTAARTIDFNPYTAQVVTDRPAIADVPSSLQQNAVFQDVNTTTGGALAKTYGDINAGNAQVFQGDNNIPMVYLGGTNQAYELIPSSTPGVYSIYVGAAGNRGDGYRVPITIDSQGNVKMPDQAITGGGIQYVGSGGGGGLFGGFDVGEILSDFGNTLADAAPYLVAGYLGTQVLPGLLSGAGAAGASGVSAESLAIANATTDPIAALNAIEGWTTADLGYLAQIGLPATYIEQAAANNAVLAGQSPNYYDGNYTATAADTASFLTPEQLAQYGASAATIAALTGGAAGGGAAGAGAAGAAGSALTGSALAKLAGGLLAGGALTGGMGGGNVTMPTPSNRAGVSTGSADYSPEYYQQLQQYYNAYMPTQPKDVATPLQQWYETKFTPDANVTNKLFGV